MTVFYGQGGKWLNAPTKLKRRVNIIEHEMLKNISNEFRAV